MQFQADLLGVPVLRPRTPRPRRSAPPRSPGSASGSGQSQEELGSLWPLEKRFEPQMDARRSGRGGARAGARPWSVRATGPQHDVKSRSRTDRMPSRWCVIARAAARRYWLVGESRSPHLSACGSTAFVAHVRARRRRRDSAADARGARRTAGAADARAPPRSRGGARRPQDRDPAFLWRARVSIRCTTPRSAAAARARASAWKTTCAPTCARPRIHFRRLRPYEIEPRLEPCIDDVRGDLSYPERPRDLRLRHGLSAGDMVPERRAQLIARADEFARQRMVCGVHFASDLEAGRQARRMAAARDSRRATVIARRTRTRHDANCARRCDLPADARHRPSSGRLAREEPLHALEETLAARRMFAGILLAATLRTCAAARAARR